MGGGGGGGGGDSKDWSTFFGGSHTKDCSMRWGVFMAHSSMYHAWILHCKHPAAPKLSSEPKACLDTLNPSLCDRRVAREKAKLPIILIALDLEASITPGIDGSGPLVVGRSRVQGN